MDPAEAGGYGPSAAAGSGLMAEDLFVRQAAQMQIEDVHGETHDVLHGRP